MNQDQFTVLTTPEEDRLARIEEVREIITDLLGHSIKGTVSSDEIDLLNLIDWYTDYQEGGMLMSEFMIKCFSLVYPSDN